MPIRFIRNHPAVLISDKIEGKGRKILVVADLHLGLENELFRSGVVIAPQCEKFQKELHRLIKMTKADTLVILGDLKHKVPGTSFRELKEVPKLLDFLVKKVELVLIKGNHDDFIERIVPKKVKVYSSRGHKMGKYGFFHGHAWPSKTIMQCDHLFMAHLHPGVEFKDRFGFRIVEPAWIKSKLDKKLVRKRYKMKPKEKLGKLQTIIVPTFNPILSGVAIDSKKRGYISPLLTNKVFDVQNAVAYLLDGTELGRIKKM
jgi:putative SbcD/Mre11-related phosphoesterase